MKVKDEGVLVSTDGLLGNIIKIKPPLSFSYKNTDSMIQALKKSMDTLV